MYANTAYEALYEIMGLQFQEEVTRWITSQVIFRAAIILIFGVAFFYFLVSFASRYLPVFLPARRAPLSKLVLLIFCLFVGISLLKVDVTTGSSNMSGVSWAQNPYITGNLPAVQDRYRVSMIFRLLSGAAEEIARALGTIVDTTFSKTHSQMQTPNFLYKALLGAAFDTIDDPKLRSEVDFYTSECLSKALPRFNPDTDSNFFDRYFSRESPADRELAQIATGPGPVNQTCLDLKRQMNQDVGQYARARSSVYERAKAEGTAIDKFMRGFGANYDNWVTSNLLVNHYLDQHEGTLGIERGTELPGTGGRIFQYLNRAFSMDGLLSLFGRRDFKGASVAATRSQELSDHLARAPHVAGFIKMLLIGFFPVLVFFLAAGRWRPVLWWWLTYLSVCLWTPLWALLYHVITALALSAETMDAYGRLGDGVSLYAASLVSSRLYQAFAVYSWLQLFVGPTLTGAMLTSLRPLLSDTKSDTIPDGAKTAATLATSYASPIAGAVLSRASTSSSLDRLAEAHPND